MKKYTKKIFTLIPIVILVFITTATDYQDARYLIYSSGPQNNVSSYSQQASKPDTCEGDTILCWIAVPETDANGVVSQVELDAFFVQHDSDNDGSLDDEEESGAIEKKSD